MDFSMDSYLEKLYHSITPRFQPPFDNLSAWEPWREALIARFRSALGTFPKRGISKAQVLASQVCDGYTRRFVVLNGDSDLPIPAYELVPEGIEGKAPAIVALHGHGYGARAIVGLTPQGNMRQGPPDYQKDFALSLCQKGFVVIVPELAGFGLRRLKEDIDKPMAQASCFRMSCNLLMMGSSMAALRVHDCLSSIDHLQGLPYVDPSRIGAMGISGGGLVASFSTILDPRIKAAVISGYFNTFKASVLGVHHCADNYIPGLLGAAEMPDLFCTLAPRPLLIEAGTQDPIFPIEAVRAGYAQLQQAYALKGAAGKLVLDVFEGDHQIAGALAYDFLARWV